MSDDKTGTVVWRDLMSTDTSKAKAFYGELFGWKVTTRAIDHPFHIHINPFWLMRLEVPDENGNLVNILERPRWQDTVSGSGWS